MHSLQKRKYRKKRQTPKQQTTPKMQTMQQNLPRRIHKPRSQTQNQNPNHKNVPKRQRHTRHLTSTKHKPKHRPISFKKTKKQIVNINPKYLDLKQTLKIRLQMDEMWSRVYCKKTPCWLWHAINHDNGDVVAYVLGSREHEVLGELLDLLDVEIVAVYSDDNYAYHEAISRNILHTGKRNTKRILRKHLTFRTRLKRLARKTICYSKSLEMHKILFGLLINVLEFNCQPF